MLTHKQITKLVKEQLKILFELESNSMKSEKSMGHFTNWKFGVPVRIIKREIHSQISASGNLIFEDTTDFVVLDDNGVSMLLSKQLFYYELIPYECGRYNSPRYPVCMSSTTTAYCNCNDSMTFLSTSNLPLKKALEPTATLTIDGKEIELSAETAARLKKELGG